MSSSTASVIALKTSSVCIFVLLIASCLYLYGINSLPRVSLRPARLVSRSEWIAAAMETEIDDPLDNTPLWELCNGKQWRKGLVFDCPRPAGGVGNVRNKVLTCVRYAIEAGADFIIPHIMTRSKQDLSALVTEDILDFEYMFNRTHFMDTLSITCPQMKIYRDMEDFVQQSWAKAYVRLDVGNLVGGGPRPNWVDRPERWKLSFEQWLNDYNIHPKDEAPIVVNIGHPLFQWPMSYESPGLRKALGRSLRFNDEVRELAASTLYSLSQFISKSDASFGIDSQTTEGIDPRIGITPGSFFGAHLRVEKDAKDAGWPSYEIQSKKYMSQALEQSLSTIYVSSGSLADIQRFKNDSWNAGGLRVVSKDMLLTGTELSVLGNMTWDQQGLVDYEVLLKSSAFGGMDGSTFALNIGIRRHLLSNMTYSGGADYLSDEQDMTISDELSKVFGGPGNNGIIYLGMWP